MIRGENMLFKLKLALLHMLLWMEIRMNRVIDYYMPVAMDAVTLT